MISLVIMIAALLLYALFAGAVSAFDSASSLRLRFISPQSGISAAAVRRFLDDPVRLKVATIVGRVLSLVVFSTSAAHLFGRPIAAYLGTLMPSNVTAVLLTAGVVTLVAAVILLALGIILPQSFLRRSGARAVFAVAVPLRTAEVILSPLTWLTQSAASRIARGFGLEEGMLSRAFEDVEDVSDELEATSHEPLKGQEFLQNVLDLASVRVRDSMIPRTEIEAAAEGATVIEVRRRFIKTGLSRLPVYRENIDSITGMVFAHDLFAEPAHLSEIIRPARYVPESKRSKDLLREFLASNTSIAVVIDEYGGTAGLVTREDVLEELFGDIQDEFDVDNDIIRRIGNDVYILSGRVRIDEINERYDLGLEEGDYDTIAGLILEHSGTIPAPPQEVVIGRFHLTILKATSSRIDLVKLTRRPAEDQHPS